jgi:predicted aminopeptidase
MNTRFLLLIFSISLSGCAKLSYMTKQGFGHLSLEWNSINNEDLLKDKEVDLEVKRKVRLILQYKRFYYDYFNKSQTNIYNETTFLENKAVTYLVILSKKNKIEAVVHNFPLVGSFPYKGFFSEKDAISFAKESEDDGYVSYTRPVYAYSTLDRTPFYDNILSSFFLYSDERLAELIFHELTHTIFFIDGEVSLNESLAEIVSEDLLIEYFKRSPKDSAFIEKQSQMSEGLAELISNLSKELNQLYKEKRLDPASILSNFLKDDFNIRVKNYCETNNMRNCWPLKGIWNNARFAAFGTYEKQQNLLKEIKRQNNLDTRAFLKYLQEQYESFNESDSDSFKLFLKKQLKLKKVAK